MMEICDDTCTDCARKQQSEPAQKLACATTNPSKKDIEAQAACEAKRWDHMDTRVLFRSGYFRFPW